MEYEAHVRVLLISRYSVFLVVIEKRAVRVSSERGRASHKAFVMIATFYLNFLFDRREVGRKAVG